MAESASSFIDPSDRRRFPRTAVLWSGKIAAEGAEASCVVLNLSAGGAKVRVSDQAGFGDDITVTVGRFGDFCGKIVWKARDLLGISFTTDAAEVRERLGATLPRCWLDEAVA